MKFDIFAFEDSPLSLKFTLEHSKVTGLQKNGFSHTDCSMFLDRNQIFSKFKRVKVKVCYSQYLQKTEVSKNKAYF